MEKNIITQYTQTGRGRHTGGELKRVYAQDAVKEKLIAATRRAVFAGQKNERKSARKIIRKIEKSGIREDCAFSATNL